MDAVPLAHSPGKGLAFDGPFGYTFNLLLNVSPGAKGTRNRCIAHPQGRLPAPQKRTDPGVCALSRVHIPNALFTRPEKKDQRTTFIILGYQHP